MMKKLPTIRKEQFLSTPLRHFIISIPFIYGILIPMMVFDLMLELYHRVCFSLYGLELISRKQYFFNDRLGLTKLNLVERINCHYCSYANGLAAYFVAIAGETEAYWCAIKHREKIALLTEPHTAEFIELEDFS